MPRREDPRKRLVQTALKLFASRGYHNTSIADILRESGCTRGTLYHYFSSKKELGFAAIDEMMRLLVEQGAGRHLRTNGHPIDRLLKMIDELPGVVKLGAGDALTPSIGARMGSVDEEFKQRLEKGYAVLVDELEGILRRGVAEGQIADSVDPLVLAHLFVIVSEGIQFASLLGQREVIWEDARRWLKEYLNSLRA
jgi:TetR/AcrR family transcriptional repressor of nem operon